MNDVHGLGTIAAGRPGGPVDLEDPLTVFEQERGETGAEAAGTLDGPDPTGRGVDVRKGQDAFVAERLGGAVEVVDNTTGRGVDHSGDVGVAMGVDADDVVDLA